MKQSIIVRDTTATIPRSALDACSHCFAEISIIERMTATRTVETTKLVPMVSSFLGAKTQAVKSRELAYAIKCSPSQRVLYFFDTKNVRFASKVELRNELHLLAEVVAPISCMVYLPLGYFNSTETNHILSVLSEMQLSILVSFKEMSENSPVIDILDRLLVYRTPDSLVCVFRNQQQLVGVTHELEARAIKEVAFYTF